ncbi:hypothetical protein [Lacunisphaera limnophila]|uniref:hypothetical protein n=1 Tax=Lacunisphaera limnophila TaxID=1838286 RepID=UPI0012FDB559|nr:hypothetical protein [Lacunisphaera limnophila]
MIKTVRCQGVGDARAIVTEIFQRLMETEASRAKSVRMAISEIFKKRSQELDERDCDEAEDFIVAESIPYFRDIIASQLPIERKPKATKARPHEVSLDVAINESDRTLLDVIPATYTAEDHVRVQLDDLEIAGALAKYLGSQMAHEPDIEALQEALADIGQKLEAKDTCFEDVFFPSGFSYKRGKPKIAEWKARALHAALVDRGVELDLERFIGAFDIVPEIRPGHSDV